MGKYKKCPRCELNYIREEDDYCEVCKLEMAGEYLIDDEEELLCPKCKANYIEPGEKLCAYCMAKATVGEEAPEEVEEEEGFVSFDELGEKELEEEFESFDDDEGFDNPADFIVDEFVDDDEVEEEEEEEAIQPASDEDDFEYIDIDDVDLDDLDDEDEEEFGEDDEEFI